MTAGACDGCGKLKKLDQAGLVLVGQNVPVANIGVAANSTSWTTFMSQAEAGGQPIVPGHHPDPAHRQPGPPGHRPNCMPATTAS